MGEILKVTNLSKSFPGVKALTEIDFDLIKGEIHGLMGENGAGKSTLIKVITGLYVKDSGVINLNGRDVSFNSPNESVKNGISTVYQEINLIPMLSVAENIFLGRQPQGSRSSLIDWKTLIAGAEKAIRKLDMKIDVSLPLNSYSVAIQQMVSIARALDTSANVLILDEPTSSLDANEVEQLFKVMRALKDQGLSIIFITHFLDQVFDITDRITVLRNGRKVNVFETSKVSRLDLISSMLGKELKELETDLWDQKDSIAGEKYISLTNIKKAEYINEFSLDLHKGEVLGLAGLLGSGRSEISNIIYGIVKPDSGQIQIHGKDVKALNPRDAIARGMGFCPEDRKEDGIIPELSVRENIILAKQAKRGVFRYLSKKKRNEIANKYIKSLNIVTPSADQSVKNLSGGNQQKVILARWLAANPELLILDEPTRGIDIGAKIEIQKLIIELKNKGLAILFISSELEEVVRCSSRIAVLRDRSVIKELTGSDINEQTVMHTIAEA
ncbi:sugar ABC transporter ATP-binding protein [Oceanispirochaeta sp.]|jgi:monosaccharide-transporting ATPase|uniref:sugar ABC transporter ATP-binding protein n=1 Tax=Oceanispirochaeta sp. TaxID=2035350 RepID=UPI0026327AED|nr:sugar ABC transporter ATP-binding protein [Oceanispirochaeta sp.]MDA3958318.1 sugar ABC transporter ATP-binding protein [Oceanispirochaeta sp.]